MPYRAVGLAFVLASLAGMAHAGAPERSQLDGAIRAGRAVPYGAGLALVLTGGRHVRMINDTRGCPIEDHGLDDGHCYRYSLVQDLPDQHAFIVREAYYEGESLMLVDDRTGRQTLLDGMPVFSPDGTHFFITDDAEAKDHDNNIEIWRREGDDAVIEWSHPVKQVHVETPALKEIYHVGVVEWTKPDRISLAFSGGREDWDGHLTHGAKGWTLDADWPGE